MCSDIDISKSESGAEVHIRLGTSCWPGPAPARLMVPPRCFPTPGPAASGPGQGRDTGGWAVRRPGGTVTRRTLQRDGEVRRPWSSFVPVTG